VTRKKQVRVWCGELSASEHAHVWRMERCVYCVRACTRLAHGAVRLLRQSMHTSGAWSGAFIAHSLAWKNDWDPKVSDGVLQCNTMFYQGHLNKHRPFKVWKTSTKLVRAFRSSLEWKIWTSTVTIHLCQRGAALQAVGV